MDVLARRKALRRCKDLPFVLGSNFVGVIHRCGPAAEDLGFTLGERVASVVKWGSNSKYVSIPASKLTLVPKSLDSAEIATMLAIYLPAFQALHHGRSRPHRYSEDCLRGRSIFVTGGAKLEVQALLKLALFGGADKIFVTAPEEHNQVLKRIKNVTVLSENPKEWLPLVKENMHLVVDFLFPKHFVKIKQTLKRKGRLVCIAPRKANADSPCMFNWDSFYERSRVSMMKRATMYDFAESFALCPDEMKQDLEFLLKLLTTRQVRPSIEKIITLDDVPAAHADLQTRPLRGAIVCEPWKES